MRVLSEINVEALQPVLLLVLKGIDLALDRLKLDLDFLPRLVFQIGDLRFEHRYVDRLLVRRSGRPVVLTQVVGQNPFLLFEFRKLFPIAIGNGGEFPHK